MLQTARLRLRRWRPEDREPFAALNADPRVMEFFPACLDRAASDAQVDRFEAHFAAHGFAPGAVELPGTAPFIGVIGLGIPRFQAHFTPCVEIAWRLAHEYWGCGYATEGARCALVHGFSTLGLNEIVAFTARDNRRSRAVMERLGMHRDPADDFEHPSLPEGHRLRLHVLYRVAAPADD